MRAVGDVVDREQSRAGEHGSPGADEKFAFVVDLQAFPGAREHGGFGQRGGEDGRRRIRDVEYLHALLAAEQIAGEEGADIGAMVEGGRGDTAADTRVAAESGDIAAVALGTALAVPVGGGNIALQAGLGTGGRVEPAPHAARPTATVLRPPISVTRPGEPDSGCAERIPVGSSNAAAAAITEIRRARSQCCDLIVSLGGEGAFRPDGTRCGRDVPGSLMWAGDAVVRSLSRVRQRSTNRT